MRTALRRTLLSIVVVLVVASAAPVHAAVLDGDLIDGARVSTRPELRASAPDVYIPAGQLTTLDGRDLWSRDASAHRAMASTTKIMTAVVVLENAALDDKVTVDRAVTQAGESGMNLRVGESLTVRQMLEGLLIQSGNDAAVALAEHVGGSVAGFVEMMNEKAAALDLIDTHFANPHGLDAPGHYTSAADLTELARYAMRNPEFRRIVAIYTKSIVTQRYTHVLQSHNLLLKQYQGAEGIKTGWTSDAGYCVVAAARRGDVELVATVMGASSEGSRLTQARRLLDWGFAHYSVVEVSEQGERGRDVAVSDYVDRAVPTQVSETTSAALFDLAGPVRRRIALVPQVRAPVTRGQQLGTLDVYQGDRLLTQVPVVATEDVPFPTVTQRISFFFIRLWRGIFGG